MIESESRPQRQPVPGWAWGIAVQVALWALVTQKPPVLFPALLPMQNLIALAVLGAAFLHLVTYPRMFKSFVVTFIGSGLLIWGGTLR